MPKSNKTLTATFKKNNVPVKVDDFPYTPKKNAFSGGGWDSIFLSRFNVVSRYSEATAHRLPTSTAHHTTQFAKFLLVFVDAKNVGEQKWGFKMGLKWCLWSLRVRGLESL